jgi:hypothetical protein
MGASRVTPGRKAELWQRDPRPPCSTASASRWWSARSLAQACSRLKTAQYKHYSVFTQYIPTRVGSKAHPPPAVSVSAPSAHV